MFFTFKEIKAIPKLSWCAILEKGSENIQVLHGSWVEVKDQFFVEGYGTPSFQMGFLIKTVY